jgi:hypothetical protein
MKKTLWFLLGMIAFATICAAPLSAQESSSQNTITLYGPLKYNHDQSRATIDFERGAPPPRRGRWDVGYGFLYAGEEFDWFQSGGSPDSRSVIRDLGKHAWTDKLTIPVVEPLPKLKPGEQRRVVVDVSGADGQDGKPGAPGAPGTPGAPPGAPGIPGADGDGLVSNAVLPENPSPPPARKTRPKHDGKPRVDPPFVKAIVGHMYVIHVVDETRDFYALFRVESLQKGDNCTITWKLIAAPQPAEAKKN